MAINGAIVENASIVIKVETIHRIKIVIAAPLLKVAIQEAISRISSVDKSQLMYTCPLCTVVKHPTIPLLDSKG